MIYSFQNVPENETEEVVSPLESEVDEITLRSEVEDIDEEVGPKTAQKVFFLLFKECLLLITNISFTV